ncbi:MAG TPA: lycopene cyclase domain-containing protein [Longimicrobiaceae bacterium]|nr:lycopene cyclase domain-containing protein [Longimicrobiaceae bacterium]
MSYLGFHAIFIFPPLLVLAWLNRGRLSRVHPRAGVFLIAMTMIALIYTTPWDNYLIWRGVWTYSADRVIGVIGYVPIEEYLFFVLQPLLSGLWLYLLLPTDRRIASRWATWFGAAIYFALAIIGVLLLTRPDGTYLGLILVWAAPVLAMQWAYAGREIWRRRGAWALGVAAPTLYLWIADSVAIRLEIWQISEAHTLGITFGSLPLEEAVFFLVTNLLVVQGLLLFIYPPRQAGPAR